MTAFTLMVALVAFVLSAEAFRMNSAFASPAMMKRASRSLSMMSTPGGTASQVTGAMPTASEYLEIIEPGEYLMFIVHDFDMWFV